MTNRLTPITGHQIPVAAIYDHPTPRALAHHLRMELAEGNARNSANCDPPAEQAPAD
jgi:hypothetical protein